MHRSASVPIVLNYTGYSLVILKFPTKNRVSEDVSYKKIELPSLGSPICKIKESFKEGEQFGVCNIDITGLPLPKIGHVLVVNREIASLIYGTRKDVMVPINYHFESSENILKPEEMRLVCDTIADFIVFL
jgi:hypothetical protein